MAYGIIKQLSSYTLHATESIVYTAPVSKSVEVATFWFHNTGSAVITAQMFFPFTGSTATVGLSGNIQRLSEGFSGSVTLEISPKVPFMLNSVTGSHGEKITMKASNSGSLNVIINGREEV
jgi:hypothetical protein